LTRFYLPSSGEAAASPAFDAGWEDTSIAERHKAVTSRISSAMQTVAFTDINTSNRDILFRQYVSEPLAAQTIPAQTITAQIRGREAHPLGNMYLAWGIRVVSGDGGTVRGTLVAVHRDNNELVVGTLTNRWDGVSGARLVVQSGDRLVFEVGTGGAPTSAIGHDSDLSLGDDNATDLPEDDTATTAYNPWVEFSQTLAFGRTLNFEPVVVATAFPQFAMTPGGLTLHFTPVAVATVFPAFSITGSHVAERLGQLLSSEPVRFDKGTGAPVHAAPKGTPYWRQDNNTVYVNNDGATSWTQIGGGGGMADHGNEYHTPDFEATGVAAGLVTAHAGAADPHPEYVRPYNFTVSPIEGDVLTYAGAMWKAAGPTGKFKLFVSLGESATGEVFGPT
jgi:hypothetical protein